MGGLYWSGLTFEDAPELLWSFMGQYYSQATPPLRVLLPWIPADQEEADEGEGQESTEGTPLTGGLSARETLEQTLADRRGGAVRIVPPQWATTSSSILPSPTRGRSTAAGAEVVELKDSGAAGQSSQPLPEPPARIECVDVSHTGWPANPRGHGGV